MSEDAPLPAPGSEVLQLGLDVVAAACAALEIVAAYLREHPTAGPRYASAVAKLEQSLADYDGRGVVNALYHLGHASRDQEALRLFQRGKKQPAKAGARKRGEQLLTVTPEMAAKMQAYLDRGNTISATSSKFGVSRSTVRRHCTKSGHT